MSNRIHIFLFLLCGICFLPQVTFAHRSGCHNLHTCSSDTSTYVCGDLGYPCNGATSIEQIDSSTIFVPVAVEKMFMDVFGRKPTDAESEYWKNRFRTDKNSIYKLRPAMLWHKNKGSVGPKLGAQVPTTIDMAKNLGSMFASVYDGRMPTASEYKYWIFRIKAKPTPPAMIGAMNYHKVNGITH